MFNTFPTPDVRTCQQGAEYIWKLDLFCPWGLSLCARCVSHMLMPRTVRLARLVWLLCECKTEQEKLPMVWTGKRVSACWILIGLFSFFFPVFSIAFSFAEGRAEAPLSWTGRSRRRPWGWQWSLSRARIWTHRFLRGNSSSTQLFHDFTPVITRTVECGEESQSNSFLQPESSRRY